MIVVSEVTMRGWANVTLIALLALVASPLQAARPSNKVKLETPAPPPAAQPAPPVQSGDRESIAIMSFAARGVDQHIADIVTQSVTGAIDRLGVFRVISADDIRSMLTAEALKQAVGCSESSCLAEIAGAIGATYIVAGSVGKLGNAYQLALTLIDQQRAQTIDRVVRQDEVAVSALPGLADNAARQVVRKLLAAKQGALDLMANETGADVVVDDALVGVTPLDAPIKLPQGPHRLTVAKAGFINQRQDVEIRPNETVGVSVRLTPSAELREVYRSRNRTLRALAWLGTGTALAGAAVWGGAVVFNQQRRDEASKLLNNETVFGSDPDHPRILIADSPEVARYQNLQTQALVSTAVAYGALGVATLSAIGAVVLWIVGDDPDRYDR